MNIFTKQYDGESIVDVFRDVSEAFQERFTPVFATIPRDEHGFHKGTFKVSIVWQDDAEPAAPVLTDEEMRDIANASLNRELAKQGLRHAIRQAEISLTGMSYGDEKHGELSGYTRGWRDCLSIFKKLLTPATKPEPASEDTGRASFYQGGGSHD